MQKFPKELIRKEDYPISTEIILLAKNIGNGGKVFFNVNTLLEAGTNNEFEILFEAEKPLCEYWEVRLRFKTIEDKNIFKRNAEKLIGIPLEDYYELVMESQRECFQFVTKKKISRKELL